MGSYDQYENHNCIVTKQLISRRESNNFRVGICINVSLAHNHSGLPLPKLVHPHYGDVIMSTIVSQITSLTIVYSTVYSDADQRKYQSSASLAFVPGIHRWIPKYFHLMTSSKYILTRSCLEMIAKLEMSSGWLPWSKTSFNVPSNDHGSHPDVSMIISSVSLMLSYMFLDSIDFDISLSNMTRYWIQYEREKTKIMGHFSEVFFFFFF